MSHSKWMNWSQIGVLCAAGVLLPASVAQAALIVDVRVPTDGKVTVVDAIGDTVALDFYGIVTGADATSNEGMQSAYGSLVSGNGGLLGVISQITAVAPFTGTVQLGAAFDFDGDTDSDRGAADGGTVANFIQVRSSTLTTTGSTPVVFGGAAGNEFLLGRATFTVTSLNGLNGTTINWRPRLSVTTTSVTTAALWQQDGTGSSNPGAAAYDPATSPYRPGTPVTINVLPIPEPAGLGLVGLAAAGLLARRRDRQSTKA